jgi:hypothetical protein
VSWIIPREKLNAPSNQVGPYSHCERSEAIYKPFVDGDCFALLALTRVGFDPDLPDWKAPDQHSSMFDRVNFGIE